MKIKLLLTATVAAIALQGCTTIGRIVDFGSAANDEAVDTSVFTICQAASIGAVRREFSTPERAEVWQRLCANPNEFNPTQPTRQP